MSAVTDGMQIYNNYVNSKPFGFWGVPSLKGVAVLQKCNEALSKLGSHDLFNGNFHQTYTTVGEMITINQRRIYRWESYLDSLDNNN